MSDDIVGLDPDATRYLADTVSFAEETAAFLAQDLPITLSIAMLDDDGSAALCAEIAEELGLLRRLLADRAGAMEACDAGLMASSDSLLPTLWVSLQDGVGEGLDLEQGFLGVWVPISADVAATTLGEWLRRQGIEGVRADTGELEALLGDDSVPAHIRAALQFFQFNDGAHRAALDEWGELTADSLVHFVDVNEAREARGIWDRHQFGRQRCVPPAQRRGCRPQHRSIARRPDTTSSVVGVLQVGERPVSRSHQ